MAARLHLSTTTIRRVQLRIGLKPHLHLAFKLARDLRFVGRLVDVVGLHLAPPGHAIVPNTDEKNQIQVVNCSQSGLPMKPGRANIMTYGYQRNDATTLVAALNTLGDKGVAMCSGRHTQREWLTFLRPID